jgi:hypothetical protein
MRRRFILYVHEQQASSEGLDLLKSRLTGYEIVDIDVDINAYEESISIIDKSLNEFNPDVIISEGIAAFFVHHLCGYNRICVNAQIHPSLRCEKSLVKMYRDMEKTQLAYDRSQDFDEGTHCWGVFGLDVERRDFAMLYYPNITTIPRIVTKVSDAIKECSALVSMIAESNKTDEYGVHFTEYGRVLVKADYPLFRGVKEYNVPEGVVAISDGAFCGSELESITFPESVSYIGKCCFRDCQLMKDITLPPRLSTIQAGCFLNCTSLNRVVLPKALTTIRAKAFWGCGLNSIEVPNSILTISPKAFDDGVKMIVGASKLTELLQTAKNYQLSIDEGD